MNKIFNKRFFSAVAAIVTLIVAFAVCYSMAFTVGNFSVYGTVGKPISSANIDNVVDYANCSVSPSGEYKVTGFDPHMVLQIPSSGARALKINTSLPVKNSIQFRVYTAQESGQFSEENSYAGCIFKGEKSGTVEIPYGEYIEVRMDIEGDVAFKNIELYSEKPVLCPFNAHPSAANYIFVISVPIILAAAVWFLNQKTEFVQKLLCSIKEKKGRILLFFLLTAAAAALALLIEFILSGSTGLNPYRWVFIFGAAELPVIFLLGYRDVTARPEKLFLGIALTLGAVMLFGSPMMHICWDMDTHYPQSVNASYFGAAYTTLADKLLVSNGAFNPDITRESLQKFITGLNGADNIIVDSTMQSYTLSYLPAGIFIALGRLLGLSFAAKYNFGRLAFLLVYSFVCYFAIKKIKSGKMILSVIALLPTALFLTTNYSCDYWVTSLSMLGTAYYVNILQNPKQKIKTSDTVIMCAAFALASLPKLVYIILMLMALFVFKQWEPGEKKRYYRTVFVIFAVMLVLFAVNSFSQISGPGDIRGGAVNPKGQILGILKAPFWYAKVLAKFLLKYMSVGNMKNYISTFAYMGNGSFAAVFIILICFTAITDNNPRLNFRIPPIIRVCSVIMYVGLAALMATALYIAFTPVGNGEINGCQSRYLIPLLSPFILLLTGQRFNLIKNKTAYNGTVLGVASVAVLAQTYQMIISVMV